MILGLETSCDETCAALVDEDGTVLANVVASQSSFHERYGGVVPEIASRRHLELVGPVVRTALADGGLELREVDRIAVTAGPGLVGALLVGVSAAKAYAYASGRPLVPVDHLHGHVASLFLAPDAVEPPLMVLLASGGHTLLLRVEAHDRFTVLGRSLDDAAGEALDKGARLLGLGYPGGPAIERLARDGDPDRIALPTPMAGRAGLDLSFSGLKTALLHRVQAARGDARRGPRRPRRGLPARRRARARRAGGRGGGRPRPAGDRRRRRRRGQRRARGRRWPRPRPRTASRCTPRRWPTAATTRR